MNETLYFLVVYTNSRSEYEFILESIGLGQYEMRLYSLSVTRFIPSYEPIINGSVNITRGK